MKNLMRITASAIFMVFLSIPAVAASEVYLGHSIRGMSHVTGDEMIGLSVGSENVRFSGAIIGEVPTIHAGLRYDCGGAFAGIGAGLAGVHPRLDGAYQFTLELGVKVKDFTIRWMHISNGAQMFNPRNMDDNMGLDFLTLGVIF